MKQVYLLFILTILANADGLDFSFLQQNEFGRRVLKEQQIVLKSSNSKKYYKKIDVVDLIINLNNFEQELVVESQKLMKEFQIVQSNNIERKQAAKQKIFLSKYQMQNLVEEQSIVSKEKDFASFIYETRKKLLQEENKFIPQMQAIRNDEIDKLNELKKEIKMTDKILDYISEYFLELVYFLERDPNMQENQSFMANTQKQQDNIKFDKMSSIIKSELESIYVDNPYTLILQSLKPLLKPDNSELLKQIPDILKYLKEALISSSEEIEQVSAERDELFNTEKNQLKKDIDKRSIECEQIRLIFERTQQSEIRLNNEINQLKDDIQSYHTEQEQLQTEIEQYQVFFVINNKKEYKSKLKLNLTNLEIIRKVKLLMNQNQQQYLSQLRQKVSY